MSIVFVVLASSMMGAAPAYAARGSYPCRVLVYGATEAKYLQLSAKQGGLAARPTSNQTVVDVMRTPVSVRHEEGKLSVHQGR